MSNYRVATRYAKSLLDLAKEKGQLDAVKKDIGLLENILAQSSEFRAIIKSPVIKGDKKQEIFNKIFKGNLNPITDSFIQLLLRKGREASLNEVSQSFISQYNQLKNITKVTLTSAVKLDSATVEKMISSLKRNENLGEVELTELVNPEIIGGFILKYGDKMIDTSVSRRVNLLHDIIEDDSYIKKYS